MSYSCTDFVDSILDALDIELPKELYDSPSGQADLALAEIERLQRFRLCVDYAAQVYDYKKDASLFIARVKVLLQEYGVQGDRK